MYSGNPILKEKKQPIRSGIHRKLITRSYCMGKTFVVADCESFYDMDKIEIVKKEFQYK